MKFSPEWIHRYYTDAAFYALANLLYGPGITSTEVERLWHIDKAHDLVRCFTMPTT